jgi:Protein of unknown function (DUF3048) N-terminal domain/Protein of unknown function (DUF3048) C-terminal domain
VKSERLAAAGCAFLLVAGCSLPWSRTAPQHRHVPPRPARPPVGAQFLVDGSPVSGAVRLTARSHVRVAFAAQVPPGAVAVMADGKLVPADALAWSPDLLSVEVPLSGVTPGHKFQVTVGAPAPIATPESLQATMQVTVPANSTTGVQPGFQAHTPILVVVENSGPARPQSGLQDADIVYEYLSEYSVTRMTAIYFAHVPAQVGPMRSCRMINTYLGYAYDALTLCSGVSDGTGGWIVGTTPGSQPIANLMESTDRSGHFFRVGFRAAPHNLYTSGDRAEPLRITQSVPGADYAVDPPHEDVVAGQPADPPQVPLHGVTYAYDGGSRQYLRFNDGAPFGDLVTGQQVHAKNVVLMHVDFHDAGWVEDENGGAHSVWYHMLGSGPAEVYSDGQVVHATWHMGAAGQSYFDNRTPVWFTDEAGKVLLLNTGLTWIHVLGNGQERCPRSPSDCG